MTSSNKNASPESAPEGWTHPPYTSISTAYRPPAYPESNTAYHITALKSFPMSAYSDEYSMGMAVAYTLKAAEYVLENLKRKSRGEPTVTPDPPGHFGDNYAISPEELEPPKG